MNIFAIIILAALIADYLLGLAANLLNLKRLGTDVPAPLHGIYKAEDYRRSQE